MFAAKAAKGVNSVELQREAKHRSLLAAKAAEAQAAKEVRVRVTVHAKAASNLIAVDNRQFSMTSDPYLDAHICGTDAVTGVRHSGEHAQTRSLKRTLAPKWDEWLLLHSLPITLETEPIPPFRAKIGDGDEESVEYVASVIEACRAARDELMGKSSSLFVRLDVFDKDALSEDDPLGHATVGVEEIIREGTLIRKGTYELEGDWNLKFTVGMSRKFKKAMTGTLHLKFQLALPQLPPTFSVDTEDILRRLRPDKIGKSDAAIRKYKPFRCRHCSLRFKASKTLRLHLDLHVREKGIGKEANERIQEEQQRLDEAAHMLALRNKQALIERQNGVNRNTASDSNGATSTIQRTNVVASTKDTWKKDCQLGRKASVLYALAHGYFLINIRDHHDRKTPLIVASRWGVSPLVKALLLRKADVTLQDVHGNSAIAFAAQYGHLAIVQMLYGAREGETMLEVSNSMDLTPLHRSAMYGHQKTAAFLLEKGCDMYRLDRVGRNALDYARLYNCTETIVLLEAWAEKLSNMVSG
jgi:hypothetical protein